MNDLATKFDSRALQYLRADELLPWGATLVARGAATMRADVQLALITAAQLFARMTPHVRLEVDDAPTVAALRPFGATLVQAIHAEVARARPVGLRVLIDDALVDGGPVIGFDGFSPATLYAAGNGWVGQIGETFDSLPSNDSTNPFGPSIAAILAASEAFQLAVVEKHVFRPARVNAWDWTTNSAPPGAVPDTDTAVLGRVWTVGVGSVGSAALHFMALATRQWSARMTDHDVVKIENYSRSPVFGAQDGDNTTSKVASCERHLRSFGIAIDGTCENSLDQDRAWKSRRLGDPDVLIPTANERNIHVLTERTVPPLQIHATTGQNWQVVRLRHVPGKDACSVCALPGTIEIPDTECSTAAVQTSAGSADASLPFLSFAAGLMIAAELVAIALGGRPNAANRVFLQFRGEPLFRAPLAPVPGCVCDGRDRGLLLAAAGRYRPLSEE